MLVLRFYYSWITLCILLQVVKVLKLSHEHSSTTKRKTSLSFTIDHASTKPAPEEKFARGIGSALNYEELTSILLNNVKEVLPLGVTGWDTIVEEELHRENTQLGTASKALKRNFESLHKSEVHAADESNMMHTHIIIRAKAARKRIVKGLKEDEDTSIKRKDEEGDGIQKNLEEKDLEVYC